MKEREPIFFRRIPQGFAPDGENAEDACKRFKIGDIVKAQFSKPRNGGLHRKYWSMCSIIARNVDLTSEQVHNGLKQLIGHGRYGQINGRTIFISYETNFNAMDDVALADYYDKCARAACKWMGVADSAVAEYIALNF